MCENATSAMRYFLLMTTLFCCSVSIVNADIVSKDLVKEEFSDGDGDNTLRVNNREFPGIKTLMSADEWRAAGLNKLSIKEIKALNAWLIRYTARDATILQNQVTQIKEEVDKDIHSKIDGRFSGWSGKTQFKLKNGQVWQQRHNGRWKTELIDPQVIITRNFFGFYDMKIVEADRSIAVKRIK